MRERTAVTVYAHRHLQKFTMSQNVEKRDFRVKKWRKNREIARKMAQEETKMMQEQLALNSGQDELYVRTKPQQNSNDQVWAQVDHRQPGESGQPAFGKPFRGCQGAAIQWS